jgi:hypothetical protein
MSNRNLVILGIVVACLVAGAILQSQVTSKARPEPKNTYLIQGLNPDDVASIVIGPGENQVTLTRRGNAFFVPSLDNYPALSDEINKLISSCLDIRTTEVYTDDPANHKDLGVTEQDARAMVRFYSADSNLVTGVIVGKNKGQGRGVYVRQVIDNKVYVIPGSPWIKNRDVDYVQQELTNVERETIESVTVSSPNEVYTLRPGADEKSATLDNMPEGKKLKDAIPNRVLNGLSNLRFDDVKKESSIAPVDFDRRYVCNLRDSTVYTFSIAQKDDKWFVKCDAEFADKTPVTKTQGQVESEDELKKKEAKLLARDNAENFSQTHKGWVYEIQAYKAENLTMKLADLLEDKTPAKTEQAVKQTPQEPNEQAPAEIQEEIAGLDEAESPQAQK